MYRKGLMRLIAVVLAVTVASMQAPAAALADDEAKREAAGYETAAVEEAETVSDDAAGDAQDDEANGEKELPFNIEGMPDGYELTDDELGAKEELAESDVAERLTGLEPGRDYVDNEVICLADSEEKAGLIAEAYGGELVSYSYGIATISLKNTPLTVEEAVAAGADMELEIPAVDPNYIIRTESIEGEGDGDDIADNPLSGVVPEKIKWEDVTDIFGQYGFDDPALKLKNENYQWFHEKANTYGAWGVTTGSSKVRVAVIDTGIETWHEDLDPLRVSTVDIGGGVEDTEGSGTYAAGIIGATAGNASGGAGVAPGVEILSIKAGDGISTTGIKTMQTDMAARAVRYVSGSVSANGALIAGGARRADIINLGWSYPDYSKTFEEAIKEAYAAGVTVCAAMGDDKSNNVRYPAKYDHVIGVCATNSSDVKADFSNFGGWADIAAPGTDIYSTYVGGTAEYKKMSGTAASTAIISGACALYMSAMGHVDPDTMERILKKSVNKCSSANTGAGIIDISKMFSSDMTAPVVTLIGGEDRQGAVIGTVQDARTLKISGKVSTDSVLRLERASFNGSGTYQGSNDTGNMNREIIIYTVNEKTPAIEKGNIKEGYLYVGDIIVGNLMTDPTKEKTITVKAACVNGMGVLGKVTTMTFTVDPNYQKKTVVSANSVTITNAPEQLVAGKSVTLKAVVEPYGSISQTVTWRIASYRNGDLSKAKIDAAKGSLTTDASQGGILTVEAISRDGNARGRADIRIERNNKDKEKNPVEYIALEHSKVTVDLGDVTDFKVARLLDTKNNDLINNGAIADLTFSWKSSNLKVVNVEENGSDAVITAVGTGTAKITCQVMDGSNKTATCEVKVVSGGASTVKKTTSVEITNDLAFSTPDEGSEEWFEKKAYAFKSSNGSITSFKLFVDETNGGVDTSFAELNARALYQHEDLGSACDLIWKSSNAKVVIVEPDPDGRYAMITAVGPGKAKITCTANDGSKKKAEITCTVARPVEYIEVTGQSVIARETSATFKASKVLPKKANNREISWSILEDSHPGISIDAKKGKVTVAATARYNAVYTVVAMAKDGSAVVGMKEFAVSSGKRTKVKITTVADSKVHDVKKSGGVLKSVQVFTADTKASTSDERELYLYGDTYTGSKHDTNENILGWKSSNEKVAIVDVMGMASDGSQKVLVTGVGKGTATITCTALDGSGKKASVKVYVKVPVSGIILTPTKGRTEYVGFGKTVTSSVGYGNAYGTPSMKKVTWKCETHVIKYSIDTGEILEDDDSYDGKIKKNLFSINNKGKLTVKSEKKYREYMKKYKKDVTDEEGYYEIVAKVTATSADGSKEEGSFIYRAVDPAVNIGVYAQSGVKTVQQKSTTMTKDDSKIFKVRCNFKGGGQDPLVKPSVVSSDIAIATAYCENDGTLVINSGSKKGTAKLTITTSDGSNKKCVFKVTVG